MNYKVEKVRTLKKNYSSGSKMRKFWISLYASILGVFAFVGEAAATSTYVEITSENLASTTAYITDLFSDVSVFIWLAIGIPLAFYVIKKVVSIVGGRAR